MRNRLYCLLGLVFLVAACSNESTAPKVETPTVAVHFTSSAVCNRLDTPGDAVNMGTVEFENTTSTFSIVPVQLAARLTASSVAGAKMYFFGPTWRNSDGSITPNTDAQTDSANSYIIFGAIPAIPSNGKWSTTLRGSVPDPTPGTYTFVIVSDSVKAKASTGASATVEMGLGTFTLTLANSCP